MVSGMKVCWIGRKNLSEIAKKCVILRHGHLKTDAFRPDRAVIGGNQGAEKSFSTHFVKNAYLSPF